MKTFYNNTKVLFCSNSSWNIYNFRLNFIKELISKKYIVSVLSPRDKFTENLIKVGCKFYEIKLSRSNINLFKNFFLFIKYFIIIKKINPNLIFSYTIKPNIYTALVAKILKIKIYNTITGLGSSFLGNILIKLLIILFYRFCLKKSNLLIFQNNHDKELFIKYKILKNQKSVIIPGSGVDTNYYYYTKKQKNSFTNFLFIGRIIKDKGVYELINAFEYFKKKNLNVQLLLLGQPDSDNPSNISISKIREWEKRKILIFLGYSKDVRKFIIECDCVILPSYREGISKSLLEASSVGRPIITTNVPGCKDIVDDKITGLLCKSKDVNDLIKKIEFFLNMSQDQRNQMGKNGRNKILDNFDEKIIIDKYLGLVI